MTGKVPSHELRWLGEAPKPKYLYHYIRWHWLRQWLESGTINLNDPTLWDDPTEWLWTKWVHDNVSESVLCFCWTLNARSEAPWRFERGGDADEPPERRWSLADKAIVRITTTYDRLNTVVSAALGFGADLKGKSFLVPVKYLRTSQLIDTFDALKKRKPVALEAANALSFKRYPYEHEKEVRWVHVTKEKTATSGRQAVAVDLNKLVEAIFIDPRAKPEIVAEIREAAKQLGFKNRVVRSELFELPEPLRPFAIRRATRSWPGGNPQ